MLLDHVLLDARRNRVSHDPASVLLQSAWCGDPPERRAAMAAGRGDFQLAANIAGGPWASLAKRDLVTALRECRGEDNKRSPAMELAEAETLIAAGAVIAGLDRLAELHDKGFGAASVAFARNCHQYGDHKSALTLAGFMPEHAHMALVGARAALALDDADAAEELLAPFLYGALPVLDALDAGAFGVLAAAVLARRNQHKELRRFGSFLLHAPDAPQEMTPSIARVSWFAGLANQAWKRFEAAQGGGGWAASGRLELAMLSGNAELATRLFRQAGAHGAPSESMLTLLAGKAVDREEADRIFAKGRLVHVWRTHPHRWKPWIDALANTPAQIGVFDLAGGQHPDSDELPDAVLDDGALAGLLEPAPPSPVRGKSGIWIENVESSNSLCRGMGIGHDWPEEEHRALLAAVGKKRLVDDPGAAAVRIASADTALTLAGDGRITIAIARPGDPFWAGPLPEQAWPGMRILRAHAATGWKACGGQGGELAVSLLLGG